MGHFAKRRGEKFSSTGIAWAMVCDGESVVCGARNPHCAEIVALILGLACNLISKGLHPMGIAESLPTFPSGPRRLWPDNTIAVRLFDASIGLVDRAFVNWIAERSPSVLQEWSHFQA